MNFCHRRPVSAVFTEHWWVGSEWRGSSCSFDTAGSRPASSHWSHTLKWPQNLDSSSGSCSLAVPQSFWWAGNQCLCWTVKLCSSGSLQQPENISQTNWTSSSLERMKNKGGTSLLYKYSQYRGNVSPVHCKTFINCYTGCLLPFLKFTCSCLQEIKIMLFLIIWNTWLQVLGSKNYAFCLC